MRSEIVALLGTVVGAGLVFVGMWLGHKFGRD